MTDYYTRRIRWQWRLAALNALAALINVIVFYNNPGWITTLNLAAGAFSCWVTWTCIRDIRAIRQERTEEINHILRTDFGRQIGGKLL